MHTPIERDVKAMLRVNHAGEYGAKRIYEGQLAVLGANPTIMRMKEQEAAHLAAFETLLLRERVRPTALMPLWHLGGWAMGAATALLGEKAAMACTVAVEEAIDAHYAAQEATLGEEQAKLKHTIAQFRAEELEHRDTGLEHGAEQAPLYEMLYTGVNRLTRAAIWLSTRL